MDVIELENETQQADVVDISALCSDDDMDKQGEKKPQSGVKLTKGSKKQRFVLSGKICKRQRKLTSPVWEKFELMDPDSDGNLWCKCKKCGQKYNADSKHGTGNLIRHARACMGRTVRNIGQLRLHSKTDGSVALKPHKFDPIEFRELLDIAIAKHNLPIQLSEYQGIRDCFVYLNPDVKCFSRRTTKDDIFKMYKKEKQSLVELLCKVPGRISLTSDCWTSVTTDGYISLTAHFIDENWCLKKRILNFSFMPPPHYGAALSEKVYGLLKDWGIEKKVMSITLDNASSNDLLPDSLKLKLELLSGGLYFHVRCCAHILNLIVQDGLKDMNDAVFKVRESVKYFKGSQHRKQRFLSCVQYVDLQASKGLRQDVPTRWNSTFHVLENALYYKKAFVHFSTDANYVHCPTEEKWVTIEKISRFLKVFHEVTEAFSGSKYPTANLYFPNVLKIRILLKEQMESAYAFMRNMARKMYTKFEKYWSDFSTIMAIAVVFDPRYKFTIVDWAYKKVYGDNSTIELEIFKRKLFELFYEYEAAVPSSSETLTTQNVQIRMNEGSDAFMTEFGHYSSETFTTTTKSQLELYLEDPKLPRTSNLSVLEYWKRDGERYSILAQMARDILAIPISTVASESAFSIGGKVLDALRSSLKPTTVEALICLRDWAFDQDIMELDVEDLCGQIQSMTVEDDNGDN